AATPKVTLLLHHKKITEKDFQVDTVTNSNGHFIAPVDGSLMDELGMEFYLRAQDEAGRTDSTAVSKIHPTFDNASSPVFINDTFHGAFNDYQIVSIPYDLNDNLIQTIFESRLGAYDVTKWRLGHFQNGQVTEFENGINKIERGLGYWFNAK